jgi:AcrR family transcriptional regulator
MIHHYFGSKVGLLEAIVEQFGSRVFSVPMRLLEKPPRSKEDFLLRLEMLFEATLDAYIENRPTLMVVVREQANPETLPEYVKSLANFLDLAKTKGYARKELNTEMVTGFMLDRILNQVQFAPWIKRTYGSDLLGDPKYKRKWCEANFDVLMNGILA